jgi:dihydrofolate synthase/folylpolyglutamate synthase
VIAQIAQEHGCRMLEAGRDFRHSYQPPVGLDQTDSWGRLDFRSDFADGPFQLNHVPMRMVGEHQAANAALALATAQELRHQGWLISTHAMHTALSELALPGRVEVVRRRPTVVLDVAHNVASARALAEVLSQSFRSEKRTLILAATSDKDVRGIIRELAPLFRRVVVTAYQENPRSVPTTKLARWVRAEYIRLGRRDADSCALEAPLPIDAWKLVESMAGPEELVCITGSFFIAAELRRVLLAAPLPQ